MNPEPISVLSATAIAAAMRPDTQARFSQILVHSSVSSTNDVLWQQLLAGQLQPAVCLAERQTDGRGRRGKSWLSPATGNLYLSLLWPFAADCEPRGLSIAIGICLVQTLKAYGINELQIKWPNDVLHRGHKLAGILIESRFNGQHNTVIGIGLNFRLPTQFHNEIAQPTTSLEHICDRVPCRNQLAGFLIENMTSAIQRFEQHGLNDFLPEWQSLDAYYQHPIQISNDQESFSAVAMGINAQGELLYQRDGQLLSLSNSHFSIRPSI